MKTQVLVAVLLGSWGATACRQPAAPLTRQPLAWSGWIEEAAVQRGHITAGDFAQFGCPPGWLGVEDTAAALRGDKPSVRYLGADPPPREGTITCVAQKEFALPPPQTSRHPAGAATRRPLAPVWVEIGAESTTIGFRSELPASAAIYIARDTPCGPRVIGVRLGDLLTWLADPQSAPKRDFLGMVRGGCPDGR